MYAKWQSFHFFHLPLPSDSYDDDDDIIIIIRVQSHHWFNFGWFWHLALRKIYLFMHLLYLGSFSLNLTNFHWAGLCYVCMVYQTTENQTKIQSTNQSIVQHHIVSQTHRVETFTDLYVYLKRFHISVSIWLDGDLLVVQVWGWLRQVLQVLGPTN